LGHRY